ncbi:MAG TPA: anti-sigma factor [Intrasporangium sp.]|nr:anti-sigma factor [Intrasporangium sp.]
MNDDIHALSGPYAVDALDPEEREQFERHLAECPACQDEVAGLRAAATQLSALVETAPPVGLRESVLRQISTVRPLPPLRQEAPPEPAAEPARLRRQPWLLAAVAAALVAVAALGIWRAVDTTPPPTVAERVLEAPDATRVAHRFPDGASATVVRSKQVGRAVLITSDMPAPPAGKVYQLWLEDRAGVMQPAGLMSGSGNKVVVLSGDAGQASAAGITVEPAGGSARPTTQPLALFAFS